MKILGLIEGPEQVDKFAPIAKRPTLLCGDEIPAEIQCAMLAVCTLNCTKLKGQ